MGFKDILKKSFLEGFATSEITTKTILVALGMTALLALYIFLCYWFMTRRSFYSRDFNIALVAVSLITAGVILTIQSSVVVSLGMVGALSIVRFRTAVKNPMDLVFLFWAIGVGIMCGAGVSEIAILTSAVVTVIILLLHFIPESSAPMILVLNYQGGEELEKSIRETLKKHSGYYDEKSRSITNGVTDCVYELRTKQGQQLTTELAGMNGVSSVSLMSHDGEVTY